MITGGEQRFHPDGPSSYGLLRATPNAAITPAEHVDDVGAGEEQPDGVDFAVPAAYFVLITVLRDSATTAGDADDFS